MLPRHKLRCIVPKHMPNQPILAAPHTTPDVMSPLALLKQYGEARAPLLLICRIGIPANMLFAILEAWAAWFTSWSVLWYVLPVHAVLIPSHMAAWWLVQRERYDMAAGLLAYSILAIIPGVAWVLPGLYPVFALLANVVVLLALPYLSQRQLHALVAVSFATGLCATAYAARIAHPTAPVWLILLSTAAGLSVVLIMTLQYNGRLTRTLMAAHNAESAFRQLAESMPQLVWATDENGGLNYINSRCLSYFGDNAFDKLQNLGTEACYPEDKARLMAAWADSLATGTGLAVEVRLIPEQGEARWFLVRAVPRLDATGRATHWYGTSTDIDALKRARQDAEDALLRRDQFVSVASHELRTPLTALTLQVDTLDRLVGKHPNVDWERILGKVSALHKQTKRLGLLINELLDVTQMMAGRLRFKRAPTDLSCLARAVVEQFQDEAERLGSSVSLHVDEQVIGYWDALRLEQVLMNLLNNAMKYGAGKAIEVDIRQDGAHALVSVRDHGIGIAANQRQRIFEKFERAVSARNYSGLGLGLWIVVQILEGMDGSIDVDSELGEGSTFKIALPIHREALAAPAAHV